MLSFIIVLFQNILTFIYHPHGAQLAQAENAELRSVSAAATSISFNTSQSQVAPRDYATLNLYASGMSMCLIRGGIYGGGQQVSLPSWSGWTGKLTTTQTFTLSCTAADGTSHVRSITVSVIQPTPIPTHIPTPLISKYVTVPPVPTFAPIPTIKNGAPFVSQTPIPTTSLFSDPVLITTTHRFHQDKMFGGWGPHLGHYLRASDGNLWFVDDRGSDVMQNAGLTYSKKTRDQWKVVIEKPFHGSIQQNTASILKDDVILTYGIDSGRQRIEECYFVISTQEHACNSVPLDIGPQANYIGAALSPTGHQIVWWTNVREGGGEFGYIANYGGGWNGPTKSSIGGYSDVSYVNIAFSSPIQFVMVGQAVSGAAPQWNYTGVMATGTMGQSLTWQPLPNTPAGTPQSTNDIYIDPSGGTHILMRTIAGITQYFFIPSKGNPTAIFDIPGAYRARFIATNDMLFLTYSVKEHLIAHSYPLPSGTPLSKLDNNPIRIKTPPAYGTIFAIYPESRIYQTTPVKVASFAFTGSSKQNEVHEQVIR